jgi:hypothetical protein
MLLIEDEQYAKLYKRYQLAQQVEAVT